MWKQIRADCLFRAWLAFTMAALALSTAAADEPAPAGAEKPVAIVINLSVKLRAEYEFAQAHFPDYGTLRESGARERCFTKSTRSTIRRDNMCSMGCGATLMRVPRICNVPYAKALKLVLDRTLERSAQANAGKVRPGRPSSYQRPRSKSPDSYRPRCGGIPPACR
jgi:hypothetical protein